MTINGKLANWDAAMQLVDGEPDRRTKRLLKRFAGAIAEHGAKGDIRPSTDVDVLYCFRIIQLVCREHAFIEAVMQDRPAGEWWDDEDP